MFIMMYPLDVVLTHFWTLWNTLWNTIFAEVQLNTARNGYIASCPREAERVEQLVRASILPGPSTPSREELS